MRNSLTDTMPRALSGGIRYQRAQTQRFVILHPEGPPMARHSETDFFVEQVLQRKGRLSPWYPMI